MKPVFKGLPRERVFALLGMLFLLGFIVLLVVEAGRALEREIRFAEQNAETLSRVLQGHAQASIEKIDVALMDVVADYQYGDYPTTRFNQKLGRVLRSIPESQSLRIANANGNFIFDATGKLPNASVADRQYFLKNKEHPGAGLVISEPIFARITKNWVITLSRRLETPDGKFAGIVQAALPGSFFETFYRQLNVGEQGVIAIMDLTPRLLGRMPEQPEKMGTSLAQTVIAERLGQGDSEGVVHIVSAVDGVSRIQAFRRVGDYPIVVIVGLSKDVVLKEWRHKVFMHALSALFLCLLMLWLIVVWHRSHRLALEDARHKDQYDQLTDLPNRLLLSEYLARSLGRTSEQRGQIALLLLDLDHFKHVNESLGHDTGDRLLQVVAQRLGHVLSAKDMVSRQGGDEFVILLVNCTGPADVARIAERLLQAVAVPLEMNGQELSLSASIGIGMYPHDGLDIQDLLKSADVAMYQAKSVGRANFQFFAQEMNEQVSRRLWLESGLRKCLQRQELLLHYQPQFRIEGKTLIGFEALVRWQHPLEGLIPPGSFIPVAEASNLIIPLGEWVLREACRQNKAWQNQGLPPVTMAVNLSAVQFRHPDLCQLVVGILEETGLEPRYLELEITESAVMQESEHAVGLLRALKQIGVRISIDDFGTGYSSLSYLKRFPIDKIKIDKSFVQDVSSDPDDAAIVEAILLIARKLGLTGIAEGVETDAQLQFLASCGCEELQGFLFGRPVPALEAAGFFLGAEVPG